MHASSRITHLSEWVHLSPEEPKLKLLVSWLLVPHWLRVRLSVQVKFLPDHLLTTCATWPRKRSTWWVNTSSKCNSSPKSTARRQKSPSANNWIVSTTESGTAVRTPKKRWLTSWVMLACQWRTTTWSTSSTESTTTMWAQPISSSKTTTTLRRPSPKSGRHTNTTSQTTPRSSANTTRTTRPTIRPRSALKMRIHWRSRARIPSLASFPRTCHPGRRSMTTSCPATQAPSASEICDCFPLFKQII